MLSGSAPAEHPRATMKPALLATLEGRPLPNLDLPDGLKSPEAASFKGWG
ncbi:hypothetical protein [Paraburkholderia eburnea]|nr:hypothetical protein [Paraburkholderia eburnea]